MTLTTLILPLVIRKPDSIASAALKGSCTDNYGKIPNLRRMLFYFKDLLSLLTLYQNLISKSLLQDFSFCEKKDLK